MRIYYQTVLKCAVGYFTNKHLNYYRSCKNKQYLGLARLQLVPLPFLFLYQRILI